MSWTVERVLALAPDSSSASSGKGLSNLSHWVSSGRNDGALWGECKGSGKTPYQTRIDLRGAEPGFKCSCPSRKFPCKHGIGLMLMYAAAPAQLPQGAPPPWVQEWLDSRGAKQEARAEKAAREDTPEEKAKKEKAAQKRTLEKARRLENGLEEFGLWLRDTVRGGLAGAPSWGFERLDTPAKRLVDAGAPGLARRVRDLSGALQGEGGQARLLERLGLLHLLVEGFKNREALSEPEQADLSSALGLTVSSEEVLATEGVRDRWLVCGQRLEEGDNLLERRSYLRGLDTGRDALVLEFSFGGKGFEAALPPGKVLSGELCFFASSAPLRALVKGELREGEGGPNGLAGDLLGLLERHADLLARQPWLERVPALLGPVRLGPDGVRDARERSVPYSPGFTGLWTLLSLSGGQPVTLFAEWNGAHLFPLGLWVEGEFHALGGSR